MKNTPTKKDAADTSEGMWRSRRTRADHWSRTTTAPKTPPPEAGDDPRVFNGKGRSIAWQIRDVHRLYAAGLQPLISREGVTVGHWYYLRILSENDGLTQRELSEKVGVHPNTAVPALDNMEKHGLVKRVRDANDRRRICVHLTAKGRQLRNEMIPDVRALVYRSLEGVASDDLEVFFKVIHRIHQNLEAEGGDRMRAIEF